MHRHSAIRLAAAFVLSLALAALAGCSTTAGYAGAGLKVANPDDAGRVVGSIAFSLDGDPQYMRYSFGFRKRGGGKDDNGFVAVANTMWNKKDEFDVAGAKLQGKTFDLQLPPGDYEIYQVYMSSDTGTVSNAFSAKEPFSVPFTVARGETVYIGQFLHRGAWGKNGFGMKVPASSWFVVSDESARDLPLIKRRDPGFDETRVTTRLPQASGVAAVFIRNAH
jgi:hypothetical protein